MLVLSGKNWHEGIIGIIASRLKDIFNKPTIIISLNNKIGKASARSVSGFDIGSTILAGVQDKILLKGGGHKMAGGFKIENSKIKDYKKFLKNKFVANVENLKKNYDSELKISAIDNQLFHKINNFSPFGIGLEGSLVA